MDPRDISAHTTRWLVGDALVLLSAAAPGADESGLEELLAMLARRHFVRSAIRIDGAVIDAVRAACVSQGVGARLTLESERLALRPLRAIVSTKPNAHLALSIVAERDGHFNADAIGTVLPEGFEVSVDGVRRPEFAGSETYTVEE